jgi:hypothetical protein
MELSGHTNPDFLDAVHEETAVLEAQLAAAVAERDEAIERCGTRGAAIDSLVEDKQALLAENVKLLEGLKRYDYQADWFNGFPLTAAEVERVKRLEAVAEAVMTVNHRTLQGGIEHYGYHSEGCPLCAAHEALGGA